MLFHPVRKKIVRRAPPEAAASGLAQEVPELLGRIYGNRSIHSARELRRSLSELPSPHLLSGMEAMTLQLEAALRQGKSILVVADYDADGATGCAVAVRGLRALGARQVSYIVPNRFTGGYGLTPELVESIGEPPSDVLLTVDNGISHHAGVIAAKKRGMTVLITDHHLPGDTLPPADAIVNPNLPGDWFPSKTLAGVGVIYYVLGALRARLRETGWFRSEAAEPNLGALLDLVALGTVADVVPLDHVNRILVHQGLVRIRAGRCHWGIRALLEVAGRNLDDLRADGLGFAVAPRLNAAGRLDDMTLGIECLLADDPAHARELARRLDTLNRERRTIEGEMSASAWETLDRYQAQADSSARAGICMYDPSWHQGVIGILASRIKDRLHRPVIVFAPSGDDGLLKGSARSIAGVHIRDVLCTIAARHPDLLHRFGGHSQAAGLTLAEEHLDRFAEVFDATVAASLTGVDLEPTVVTDGELLPEHFHIETALLLREAGPWGQSFPEPLFDGEFEVQDGKVVAERHVRLNLAVPGSGRPVEGIAFGVAEPEAWLRCRSVRMAFRLDVNEFRGSRQLQLGIEYMEAMD